MLVAKLVFWTCAVLTLHTYVLYPVVLFAAYAVAQVRRDMQYLVGRRSRRRPPLSPEELPTVSIIVPAHNGAARLPAKLANVRALDYPSEKLEMVFVSDGSTDGTSELL